MTLESRLLSCGITIFGGHVADGERMTARSSANRCLK